MTTILEIEEKLTKLREEYKTQPERRFSLELQGRALNIAKDILLKKNSHLRLLD